MTQTNVVTGYKRKLKRELVKVSIPKHHISLEGIGDNDGDDDVLEVDFSDTNIVIRGHPDNINNAVQHLNAILSDNIKVK